MCKVYYKQNEMSLVSLRRLSQQRLHYFGRIIVPSHDALKPLKQIHIPHCQHQWGQPILVLDVHVHRIFLKLQDKDKSVSQDR